MRPNFHFTAESGWINDPHAVTFRDGKYDLFYQYVPDSLVWAPNCHWGHTTTSDLISFGSQSIALKPDDGDDGIWTGSLVTDSDGSSTIFYTSVVKPNIGIGRVRTAKPRDVSWLTWDKGPIVVEPPKDLEIIAYRDPFVFRDENGWRMFVGAGLADGTATALSYLSSDLANWTYEGIAAQRSTAKTVPVWTGALWECPQLFEIDGRHVLVSSVWDDDVLHYVAYGIGTYTDGLFAADTWGRLSYGNSYYAPSFFRDSAGRPSLMFWLRHIGDSDAGWVGAHSVPHTLTLNGDTLTAAPHEALLDYRQPVSRGTTIQGLAADTVWVDGTHLEISSGRRIVATIDLNESGLSVSVGDESWEMPHDGSTVRVIADGPILEISTHLGVLAAATSPTGDSLSFSADGELSNFHLSS